MLKLLDVLSSDFWSPSVRSSPGQIYLGLAERFAEIFYLSDAFKEDSHFWSDNRSSSK